MRNIFNKLGALVLMMLPGIVIAQETEQKQIQLTFSAYGDAQSVETVMVENKSSNETLQINGNEILVLRVAGSGVEEIAGGLGEFEPLLYPNPAQGDGNLVFDAPKDGNATVSIYAMNGTMVDRATVPVVAGRNALNIPSQGYGFFMVYLDGEGYNHVTKWMCGAEKSGSVISHIGTSSVELPRETIKATRAAAPNAQYMSYTPGDLLVMTGKSGKMQTIVTRRPTVDHTVDFPMYKCEDADGYNYPVVEAGGMLWMAEDLRVVFRSGIALVRNESTWNDAETSSVRMAFENYDPKNKEIGGRYSNGGALKALPAGWQLPTEEDIYAMGEALGGMDIAGGLLKARSGKYAWDAQSGEDDIQMNVIDYGKITPGTDYLLHTRSFGFHQDKLGTAEETDYAVARISSGSDAIEFSRESLGRDDVSILPARVRGVRPVKSPYQGFISKWLADNPDFTPSYIKAGDKANANNELALMFTDKAPLGYKYNMPDVKPMLLFGGNGINKIEKPASSFGNSVFTSQKAKGYEYDKGVGYLHKRVMQTLANGEQKLVTVRWSNQATGNIDEKRTSPDYNTCRAGKVLVFDYYRDGPSKEVADTTMVNYDFEMFLPSDYDVMMADEKTFEGLDAHQVLEYMVNNHNWLTELYYRALQVQCADFNGDKTDDILVGVGNSIVILDGTDYNKILTSFKLADQTVKISSLSCAVGDITNDGITDLAVTFEDKNGNIQMHIWWNGYENFSGKPNYRRMLGSHTRAHGILIGNFSNEFKKDVISFYWDEVKRSSSTMQVRVSSFVPDRNRMDEIGYFEQEITHSVDLAADYTANMQMKLARLRGAGYLPDLLANGYLLRWGTEGITLLQKLNTFKITDKDDILYSGNIAVGNFDGNAEGREQIVYSAFNWDFSTIEQGDRPWKKSIPATVYIENGTLVNKKLPAGQHLCRYYDYAGGISIFNYNYEFSDLCAGSMDGVDSRSLELESIETTVGEPRICALLAAAPYYKENIDQYAEKPVTVWGKTDAADTEKISVATAAGYEQERNRELLATNVGGVSFGDFIAQRWAASGNVAEQTVNGGVCSTGLDDAVVLTLTPYVTYTYKVSKSRCPMETGSKMTVAIPVKPVTVTLSLTEYSILRADHPSIPDLRRLFKHTPGNPMTYKEEYADAIESYGAVIWGQGSKNNMQTTGNGAIVRTITTNSESVANGETKYELPVQLSGDKGLRVAYGQNFAGKNIVLHELTLGHTASGSVSGVPNDASKNFRWNICRKNVDFQGQKFPIVTYIVKQ